MKVKLIGLVGLVSSVVIGLPVAGDAIPTTGPPFAYVPNAGLGDISGYSIDTTTGALTELATDRSPRETT